MAVKVSEYGTPTTPSGRSVVVMAIGAARIVSEHPAVLVALALSVTWSVNARSTAASGIPEILPVAGLRLSPEGNLP